MCVSVFFFFYVFPCLCKWQSSSVKICSLSCLWSWGQSCIPQPEERKKKGMEKNNVLAFRKKVFSETVEGWNAKSSHVNPLCDLACVYSWMNFMLLWCMRCLNWHSSVDLISWTDSAPLCLDKSAQPFEFMNFHRRSAPSRLVLWKESLVAEGGILFRGFCD